MVAWATYTLFAEAVALSSEAQQSAAVPGLRRGWFLGWQMDLSDTQWRDFRGSLHILAAAMKGFVLLSLLVGMRRAAPRRAAPRCAARCSRAGAPPCRGSSAGSCCRSAAPACCRSAAPVQRPAALGLLGG